MNPQATSKVKSSAFNVIQAVVEEEDEESGRQDPAGAPRGMPLPSNEELKMFHEEEEPPGNTEERARIAREGGLSSVEVCLE